MTVLNTADALRLGSQRADAAYVGNSLVWETLERQVKRMYAGGIPGVMLDPWTRTNNYQDAARTTLVSVAGDPIGSTTDLSGNGNHASQSTSPKRPLWNDGADLDGADDALVTPSIDFTGTDKITVVVAITKKAAGAFQMVVELSGNSDVNNGTFALYAPAGLPDNYRAYLRGTSQVNGATPQAFAPPLTNVVVAQYDLSAGTIADAVKVWVNGVPQTLSTGGASTGGGAFGNYPLYIGARSEAIQFLNANIKRKLVIGRALTASELSIAERWANEPVGVL